MEQHSKVQHAHATDIIETLPVNEHSDVIFVLGSAHSHDDIARVTAERFKTFERAIVISGYSDESSNIKSLIVALGVPSSRIECEHKASNTLENFLYSKALLDMASPRRSIEIVCKDYSAPRVYLTALKTLKEWKIGIHPYRLNAVTPTIFLQKFMAETHKIGKYASKGHITSPDAIGFNPDIFIDRA
ncbi:DUF218 domain-containing protein [Kushneria avicenniae]|uniref:DUF218 domain-containing protein n=1 Tax=Kushneria avicenniae TaxID=402385 RepID=A0A1I1JQ46_9GAMM|nr:YdcF family protein [Kushneria avicenniae]SFC50749.1 DUF218 domain-containing protein [Kushneria avicenniae]